MLSGSEIAEATRIRNTQKVWARPTIPWSLTCEISREDASAIFSTRLDHLGFMNEVIYMSIFLLVVVGLTGCCWGSKERKSREAIDWMEPYLTRGIFLLIFVQQLLIVDAERVQLEGNIDNMANLHLINQCSDKYSTVKVDNISGQL